MSLILLALILIVRPVQPSADQPTGLPSSAGWIHTIGESTVSHGLAGAILLPVGLGMLVAFAVERSENQTHGRKIVGLALALLAALEA